MATTATLPRRLERIFAFKVLYGLTFTRVETLEQLESIFLESPDRPESLETASGFAWGLVKGVWQKQKEIDDTISLFSKNWRVERMGKVELSLLRIAVFELQYCVETPAKVAINEAIELSKQFGDDNSRGFVNGVLDATASAFEAGTLTRSTLV